MSWYTDFKVTAFDVETDSPDPTEAHIITAAICHINTADGQQPKSGWVLKPRRPIPAEAAAIHGYPTERADAEGSDAAECLDVIAGILAVQMSRGVPVVAFNAAFDLTCMERELARFELPTITERLGRPIGPVLDPYVIDGHLSRRKGSRRLSDQCAFYSVDHAGAHEATADALAAARVLWRLGQYCTMPKVQKVMGLTEAAVKAHSAVGAMSLEDIHAAQVKWFAARQKSRRDWLKREGKPDDTNGDGWPIRLVKP